MNVAVVGCGYWGNHLLRNFNNSSVWNLKYICDLNENQLNKQKNLYKNSIATTDYNLLLNDNELDAIVIATPVHTHFELAEQSILAGKHTWVEKPLTASADEAKILVEYAEKMDVLLHVDHTFIYTPAVKKIKEIVSQNQLGEIYYFDSVRVNLGLFQHDVNVIWDLAPHDISILQHVIGKKAKKVNAIGQSFHKYSKNDIHSLAYVTVEFDDGSIAHFNVNWLSPVKIRQIILGGSQKMLVFDDMLQSEKIKIYDSGVTLTNREEVYNTLIQYRSGDMFSPAIANYEALSNECNHFYDCISANTKTLTDGESGLYVVEILESANKSLMNGGIPINL